MPCNKLYRWWPENIGFVSSFSGGPIVWSSSLPAGATAPDISIMFRKIGHTIVGAVSINIDFGVIGRIGDISPKLRFKENCCRYGPASARGPGNRIDHPQA